METSYDRLAKIYANCIGHLTKMATTLYMVKTLLKILSLEQEGWWPWDSVFSIGDVRPTKFAKMIILGWPSPTLRQGQICFLCIYMEKNLEMLIFH